MGELIGLTHNTDGQLPPEADLATLRLMSDMNVVEFAAAIAEEANEPVPTFVYLEWEHGEAPPIDIYQSALRVAKRVNTGATVNYGPPVTRRGFIGGLAGIATLAASGFAPDSWPLERRAQDVHWRASPEMARDLNALAEQHRRSYADGRPAGRLLPETTSLMSLLISLERRRQWPREAVPASSLIGQLAVLAGLLKLMGSQDLLGALGYYQLALAAAREGEDWDLEAYVLGSLAFQALSSRRPATARSIVDAGWARAANMATPRTRAWLAGLASEIYAREGIELASRRFIELSRGALDCTATLPAWKGVGWFDDDKLAGYEGSVLMLLGHYGQAEERLRAAIARLDRSRIKHRSTAMADLAMTLVARDEPDVEEACVHASEAFHLARRIGHSESIDRVVKVQFRLMRWRNHPSVRRLTDELRETQRG